MSGPANDTKYVCYGPAGDGSCYAGDLPRRATRRSLNLGSSGSYGYGTAGAKCGDYVTLWVDCHSTQP